MHKMPKSRGIQIKTTRTQLTPVWQAIIGELSKNTWWRWPWGKASLLWGWWDGTGNSLYTEECAGSGNEKESYLWSCIKRLREYQGKTQIQKERCSKAAEGQLQ